MTTLKKLSDIKVLDLISNNTELSELSKKSYVCTIKKIIAIVEHKEADLVKLKKNGTLIEIGKKTSIFNVINNPKKFIPIFKKIIPVKRTYTSCVSFILTVSKYCKTCNQTNIDKWREEYTEQMIEVHNDRTSGLMNVEKADSHIEWNEIIKKQTELSKKDYGSDILLLLSMYSLIPPRRLKDYYRISICEDKTECKIDKDESIINLSVEKPYIKVSDYKTAKSYGEWKCELPVDLIDLIKYSLKNNPRKYLFITKKNTPFDKSNTGINSFTKQTNRELEKLFNRKVTINSLRHACATHNISLYKSNKITFKELDEVAKMMGHSIIQAMLYEQRKV